MTLLKVNIFAIFAILSFISCPSFSHLGPHSREVSSQLLGTCSVHTSDGASHWDFTQNYTPMQKPSPLIFNMDPTEKLTKMSSFEILHLGMAKLSAETRTMWQTSIIEPIYGVSEQLSSVKYREKLDTFVEGFLWMIVQAWVSLYLWLARVTWYFLASYTIPTCALILLTAYTVLLYKAVVWMFGNLPYWLILSPMKFFFRILFSKKHYLNEKMIEGFTSYKIPQKPPKDSVLELQHADGSHKGYASCIKLYNGYNGLITVNHAHTNDTRVQSLKTHNKLRLDQFKLILEDADLDLNIYMGPADWEGVLGCKAAQYVTADKLGRGPASLYTWEQESSRFVMQGTKITGTFEDKFATVLSQTEEGMSGAPYWSGKSILGVHKGSVTDHNFNLMTPIPFIPGLTGTKLVFETTQNETTAPRGKLFESFVEAKYDPSKNKGLWDEEDFDDEWYRLNPPHKFLDECRRVAGIERRIRNMPKYVPDPNDFIPCDNPSCILKEKNLNDAIELSNNRWKFYNPSPPQSVSTEDETGDYDKYRHLESTRIGYFKADTPETCSFHSDENFIFETSKPVDPVTIRSDGRNNDLFSGDVFNLSGNGIRGVVRRNNDILETTKPTSEQSMSPNDLSERIIKEVMKNLDLSTLERRITSQVSNGLMKQMKKSNPKPETPEKKPQQTSASTSKPSTTGKYVPPHQKSQGSKSAENSPDGTIPNKNNQASGGKNSQGNTQNWKPKPKASGGQSSVPKPSSNPSSSKPNGGSTDVVPPIPPPL
ncbi:P1 protein [Artemisia virus B]|uniref:P1 protein n=1 Tax=Artemisia virus B TaxID=2812730 RepID=A0A894J1M2_9VIRU|nr:P1 protein [Artemisia virus B]